jgi:Transcriptional regulators
MSSQKELKNIAYTYIKSKIISGEIPAGHDIDEGKIQEQINMSRTPIREALMKLQEELFVSIYPRKGIICTPITVNRINNIYQIRKIIEPEIVLLVCDKLDKDKLYDFEQKFNNIDNMDPSLVKNYISSIDTDLHTYIINECKNELLIKIMNNVFDHNQRIRILTYGVKDRPYSAKDEHLSIIKQLINNNAEVASAMMKHHILNSWKSSLSIEFLNT